MLFSLRYIGKHSEVIVDNVKKPEEGGVIAIETEKQDEDWLTAEGMELLHNEISRMLTVDPYRVIGRTLITKNDECYEFTVNFYNRTASIKEYNSSRRQNPPAK